MRVTRLKKEAAAMRREYKWEAFQAADGRSARLGRPARYQA